MAYNYTYQSNTKAHNYWQYITFFIVKNKIILSRHSYYKLLIIRTNNYNFIMWMDLIIQI